MNENLVPPYWHQVIHNNNRRAPWHDYRLPGTYMITLVVRDRQPLLGTLKSSPSPWVEFSPLGNEIYYNHFPRITYYYPKVKVWKICIMPDHIHFILRVTEKLDKTEHLGHIIGGFKTGVNALYWDMLKLDQHIGLFDNGYNDRWLKKKGQLKNWNNYLSDNPRRAVVKRQHPEFFKTLYDYRLGGKQCGIFGNLHLLDIPDKEAVIVHSNDSQEMYFKKFDYWMRCADCGAVLVSAAISPKEKEVINAAKELGFPVIQLYDNGFGPYYKPNGKDFDLCAEGKLLQVSPCEYHYQNIKITYKICHELNDLAVAIAGQPAIEMYQLVATPS